jgi:Flp pilus assembly pilin Flp
MFEALSLQAGRFWRSEDGPTAVEYAVILALLILGVIAGISFMRSSMEGVLTRAGDVMEPRPPIVM